MNSSTQYEAPLQASGPQQFVRMGVTALAYYLAARLGLLIPYIGSHVSLIWLPTGIALAAYLRWGHSMAPAMLFSAFLINYQIGTPAWAAAGMAAGNALGPWLSAQLLGRLGFDAALTRRVDLGQYLLAVALGMLVTASNGCAWLRMAGFLTAEQWAPAWLTWWTGDAVGALLGGIPLVAMSRANIRTSFAGRRGRFNMALLGLVLACGLLTFSPWTAPSTALTFPLLALPLFLMAVLALRAGVLAASLAVLLLSATAAWGTANGIGPFAGHDTHAGLLALWSYVTAQVCTGVLICGLAAELLASQRQQQAQFLHASEGILVVDSTGKLNAINPVARAMLELPAPEVSGTGEVQLLQLPRDNGARLAECLQQPSGAPRLLRLCRRDGQHIEVEAQIARFRDARGRQLSQLLLRDVTDSREAQAKLAASEERLRAITDNAPALIADHDREFRYRFANRTYQDWLGVAPDAVLGQTVASVLGDAAWAEVRPAMEAALRGEPATYERHIQGRAEDRWIHVALVPRRDVAGSVEGFYALASDITPRLRAEQALRQSEQRLRSITDQLPMRISYIGTDERYRFINLAYERAFGRPRQELLGRTVREVIGDGAYGEAAPRIRRALAGETVSFDSEITTREGYRCYRASYLPQFADDGREVLGFVAMILDTTAQKQEERRLIELSQSDSLTGLLNRAGFEQRMHEAVQRARSTGSAMALMLLDLDGFKQVNDKLGHLAGDLLLKAFAGRLARSLRAADIVARPGGDEFAIIIEQLATPADAATIADNIVQAMRAPFVLEHRSVQVSTSIGVALYRDEPGVTPRDISKRADDLLYAAKAAGRDRFCIEAEDAACASERTDAA
ncbi:diguanylate cyclase [Paucibacter sediminis]|uniref:Diguanylate cyclase n=1 Tax=Paucibacter sediminis TaxID=3019553 RepID=A0AA95NGY0_9BURK|nr:sensor domain-containing diguanylate cyclase [Paucibacter sp. S2-9]WIT14154.1 diguanylate cyclase [Paucibacter sp. S2-9]